MLRYTYVPIIRQISLITLVHPLEKLKQFAYVKIVMIFLVGVTFINKCRLIQAPLKCQENNNHYFIVTVSMNKAHKLSIFVSNNGFQH